MRKMILLLTLLSFTSGSRHHRSYSSLSRGDFVKIICGASNNDVPLVRNLCYVYTLAGVDCIDISADSAIVSAANEGISSAYRDYSSELLSHSSSSSSSPPRLMISVNDDDSDPHFRRAQFDPTRCPVECPRPCEKSCPAFAIPPPAKESFQGVITDKCYGCGRCVPVCPLGLIQTESYVVDRGSIQRLIASGEAQALEIHTQSGHEESFAHLWAEIGGTVLRNAQLLAISLPDRGNDLTYAYMTSIQRILERHTDWGSFTGRQIWQLDGRPMSGDIGRGTARAAVELGQRMLLLDKAAGEDSLFRSSKREGAAGFVQLAGGTNDYSIKLCGEVGLTGQRGFGGLAFGGYARKEMGKVLRSLDADSPGARIESHPQVLATCLEIAHRLIDPIKCVKKVYG